MSCENLKQEGRYSVKTTFLKDKQINIDTRVILTTVSSNESCHFTPHDLTLIEPKHGFNMKHLLVGPFAAGESYPSKFVWKIRSSEF